MARWQSVGISLGSGPWEANASDLAQLGDKGRWKRVASTLTGCGGLAEVRVRLLDTDGRWLRKADF